MEKGLIAILKADVEGQVREIDKIYDIIEERAAGNSRAELEGLSFWLHNLYCAFEDMFKLVAEAFENNVEDGKKYHIELLKRMTVQIEGVRPLFISEESFLLLDSLRAFRHLIRHAYVYVLDERKVRLVLDDARKLKQLYKGDLNQFFTILGEVE